MYDRIGHLNAVLYAPTKKEQIEAYTEWTSSADYEITRLRSRLEQAERERDHALVVQEELIEKGFRKQIYKARDEGFRAGIEAAAECEKEVGIAFGICCDETGDEYNQGWIDCTEHWLEEIRDLSPTDNTSSVADAAKVICDAWDADTLPVNDPDPMLPSFIAALRALAEQKGE